MQGAALSKSASIQLEHKMSPSLHEVQDANGWEFKVCLYVDYYLQPLVLILESYVRDSSYLISQLKDLEIPQNTLLVTLEVQSFYMIIGHEVDTQVDGSSYLFIISTM